MKERPILFSGPMVRALLDGSKTQTRRIMKPQLVYGPVAGLFNSWYLPRRDGGGTLYPNGKDKILSECPYGQPGDRLWVRETFVQGWDYDPVTDCIKQFDETGHPIPIQTWYRADGTDIGWCDADGWEANTPWKPCIHMPRAASRITLEITSVRVERLQSISEADAQAEGVEDVTAQVAPRDPEFRFWKRYRDGGLNGYTDNAIASYASLWTEINGPGSWEANPWVWAMTFRRLP